MTNHLFVLQREMEAYCKSDIKLLKAGCQKFREEFKEKADFDPIEKCSTIAPACNRFWCKKLVPKNKIASERSRGSHGSQSNQSIKALKWLAWQEHRLRLQHPTNGDHIRSVHNVGEVHIAHYLVNGFDPVIPLLNAPPCMNSTDVYGTGAPNAFLSTETDTPSVTVITPCKKSMRPPSRNKRPLDNMGTMSTSCRSANGTRKW